MLRLMGVLLVAAFMLVGCGDESAGTGGGSASPTVFQQSAPQGGGGSANTTVTPVRDNAPRGTATPDPTVTRIVGTATLEQQQGGTRPTVTPDNSDMPLGGN